MNLTLFQKGAILVAVPLLFQLAFVLTVRQFQRDQIAAERWASHTKEVIARTHEIRTEVSDAHSGIRGYAIAGEPAMADPYRRAEADLPIAFDGLAALVADNPGQQSRALAVRNRSSELLVWEGDIEALIRTGRKDEAVARIRSGRGNALIEAFRREVSGFLAEEERLDRERATVVERSRGRLNALFIAGGLFAVGSTFVLAFAFHRGIARRFLALERNARARAAGGDPPPLEGKDEIARLDGAFREIAAGLTEASGRILDLYDNAPCGYHSVDPEGIIVAINRTELAWLGYSADEVIGRMRFIDAVSPRSSDAYRATFARVKEAGAAADVELELVRRDGTTFPVLVNSSAVRDPSGRYLRSRTTLTDLTERKRAEAAIRLFADVAQTIPMGLLIYQLDDSGDPPTLRIRSCNRAASGLLGVSLDEASGRPVVEVFPSIPPDQLRRYTGVVQSSRADDLGEFQYGDARVAERWWAVQAFPLPERSVGVAFQDVTSRRRAEDEVRRLNADLELRVQTRTAELAEANRNLVQHNTENEMFVYSVSHDLRSPLVNLQGFSRELEKGCEILAALFAEEEVPPGVRDRGRAVLDGKMAKSIGFIRSAVLRLSAIIDAMLRLSRAGRVEYRPEPLDVREIINRVVSATQSTIAERGATIRIGDLPPARGDRTAVEQVFGNLIGNALTYLEPTRPGIIEIGCLPAGQDGLQTYFVRDNGLGIPEGHRPKIFLAFQRAHPGVGSGEGLGLAIVSRIVERHRGRIWVESTAGEGSTFFVTLPAAETK